jgi:competence ComEA-like helix-hairpin-helix protein
MAYGLLKKSQKPNNNEHGKMKFPFFKQPKAETTKGDTLVVGPPRVAPAPATVPRITIAPRPTPAAPMPAHSTPRPVATTSTATSDDTFPFSLTTVASQLPQALCAASPKLATTTIDIPINLVLPQLPTGKISLRLSDLILLIPSDVLPNPLPQISGQQNIALPLPQVIAAIPPKFLAVKHESTIDINDAELDSLPALFDETAATVTVPEPEPPKPAPAPVAPPPPAPAPKAESTGEKVNIRLSTILTGIPDNFLSVPRANLAGKADLNSTVGLPVAPLLSQLKAARIRLPITTVIEVIPAVLLANPLPPTAGVMVALPLMEVISQIPPHLFNAGEPAQRLEVTDADIPMPFQEKTPAPAAPTPAPIVEPQPEPVVAEAALEDESFQIFAERTPAPTPVVKPEPVVVPEPVAEIPVAAPAPEPELVVAEVAPEPAPAPTPASETPKAIEPPSMPVASESDAPYLVNLNRCTVEDLVAIEGVGPALAKRIIEHRDANGPFQSLEDLRAVPGVGRKTFRALAGAKARSLNKLLGVEHENELTLQEIVKLTGALPGVDGCLLAMADGVFLTGNLPQHLEQNTVSAFAPQLFKKVGRYTRELRVGQVQRMTIFTDQQPMSIFEAGDVYLIIVHDKRRFSKALLRQLERVSQEIARLCRQRATV